MLQKGTTSKTGGGWCANRSKITTDKSSRIASYMSKKHTKLKTRVRIWELAADREAWFLVNHVETKTWLTKQWNLNSTRKQQQQQQQQQQRQRQQQQQQQQQPQPQQQQQQQQHAFIYIYQRILCVFVHRQRSISCVLKWARTLLLPPRTHPPNPCLPKNPLRVHALST